MLVKRKQSLSSQQHQSKTIELIQLILVEPVSSHLKYFSLECLGEFSNSDDRNKSHVFFQLNRLGGLNELILNNLVEIQINPEFDMHRYLSERDISAQNATQSTSQDTGSSSLDETMNVIMSAAAMDTTISGENEIGGNHMNGKDEASREKIEIIQADLRQLIESYGRESMPVWLRTQLNDLAQFITENV